jgi:uncharacterized protein involved in response to NO
MAGHISIGAIPAITVAAKRQRVVDARNIDAPMLWLSHIFERGYRPFFFGATCLAALALPIWLFSLSGGLLPVSHLAPLNWHTHEMLFGYVPAVLSGFLLTAMPNWTGRPALSGMPLAALFVLWLAARIGLLVPGLPPLAATLLDGAFLVALTAYTWREVSAAGNMRNYPVCALITLLACANFAFHVNILQEWQSTMPTRLALSTIAILITLIGGRVTPSFTGNWMASRNISPPPPVFDRIDKLATLLVLPALVLWILDTSDDTLVGVLFALAAVALLIRLVRWRGWKTAAEPLVLILHVGFLWLPIWCALMAAAYLDIGGIDASSALHALTAGAVGTMTLAVMTRASLGHSGQPLTARPLTVAIYVLVVAGAALRTGAFALPFDYMTLLAVSGALWASAMALFAIGYGPLLLRRSASP